MSTEIEKIEAGTTTERVMPQTKGSNGAADAASRSPQNEVRALKFPSLHDINAGKHPEKTPILKDLLYPGAWLVVGRPKIGKSWLLLQLTLVVAEDGTFLGFEAAIPGAEVLAVFAEDDDERIQSRLQALGVDRAPDRSHVINQQAVIALARDFSEQMSFVEFLDAWLEAHPRVKLVIVDTETTVLQIWAGERVAGTEQSVTRADYKQTRPFDELALRRQIVIALVNHASKRKGQWADIHEIINRTNTALAAASGSIVLADPPDADPLDPTQKLRVLGVRGRDLKDDVLLAVRQREDMPYFRSEGKYIEVRQSQAEQTILQSLEGLMSGLPADTYITAKELAEATDGKRGAVKRTLTRMLEKGRKTWGKFRFVSKPGRGGGYRLDPVD